MSEAQDLIDESTAALKRYLQLLKDHEKLQTENARLRANRWANFSDEELQHLYEALARLYGFASESDKTLLESVDDEMGRRKEKPQ